MAESFLANAAQRRQSLNKVRAQLLDRPGIARRGGPPPPTAPAQDRTSPQQRSLAQSQEEQPSAVNPTEGRLEAAKQFLGQVQQKKIDQLSKSATLRPAPTSREGLLTSAKQFLNLFPRGVR